MKVLCNECGKKYSIDPLKIEGERARFKCKSCGYIVTVHKPELMGKKTVGAIPATEKRKASRSPKAPRVKLKGMGIRDKLMLFILVPVVLAFLISAFFSVNQLVSLGDIITEESMTIVTRMAEKEIVEYSRAVAMQVKLYLAGHPDLKKKNFNTDIEFKRIAVQRIGLTMTGYTSLYEVPAQEGTWRYWANINPDLIGDDMSNIEQQMGGEFIRLRNIVKSAVGGKESSGYYISKDAEGKLRENFLVCMPVKGTPYYIASTTYIDESTLGVAQIPMSKTLENYLEMISWSQEEQWWNK